jgi:hypothetical protein
MEIVNYTIKASILAIIIIAGASWLIYFSIKNLSRYTDFGRRVKKEKKKRDAAHESTDDVPDLKYADAPFLATKPKIETSFGDTRIGDVYEET